MNTRIRFRSEVFKEGGVYVALCPDLEVSSFGGTPFEARESLKEAVEGFIEECEKMGTLPEVLREAGFTRSTEGWIPRKPISSEIISIMG